MNDSKVHQRVFQLVYHFHKLPKGSSMDIPVGLSDSSTTKRFINEYFDWFISVMNYQKVHQWLFQSVYHFHKPPKGTSTGISVGLSLS